MDKELMENTIFHQGESEGEGSRMSEGNDKRKTGDIDLVYIDDDWAKVFPQPKEQHSNSLIYQENEVQLEE